MTAQAASPRTHLAYHARQLAVWTVGAITAIYVAEVILVLTGPALPAQFWSLMLHGAPLTPAGWFLGVFGGTVLVALALIAWASPRTSSQPGAAVALCAAAVVLPAAVAGAYYPLQDMARHGVVALACVPSTVAGVLLLTSAQRFARVPLQAVWAAFAWGALGAYGFASLTNDLVMRTTISALITRYFDDLQNGAPGQAILAVVTIRSIRLMAWHAGIVEELAKAVGVALLLLFGGRRVRTVVSGIVLGGIAGLGFNFSESVRYISSQYTSTASWDAGGFEYWMRQSVGLLGAHTAFSAVAGAGLAVAAGSADPRRRARAASAGLLAAIGSHVANDTLPGWFSQVTGGLGVTVSGTWDTLVLSPLLILVIQVPMVVVYVLLLRGGLREQAAGFARAVAEEAVCGAGAITPGEAAVLAHPAARLWAVAGTARRYGLAAALALRRVHSAQLQLACWRWQHCGQATDGATAGGAGADSATGGAAVPGTLRLHRLRQRVVHLKEHGLGPALEAAA